MLFALSLALVAGLSTWLIGENVRHRRRLGHVPHRLHVNGIRGKSTVTRILAGMFREAGLETIAKTTGTAAMVIDGEGVDHAIVRAGAPTILEQIGVLRRWTRPDTEALVVECMAINPLYQRVSEQRIVRSTIGVITNIREDHQDVMGETLPEIAAALAETCPTGGVLVTAEQKPELVEVLVQAAGSRGSRVVVASPDDVSDDELAAFDYIAFKENVAIGFEVAKLVGIPRDVALAGMARAKPDPGVLGVRELRIAGKQVAWANLFAVNDRESMIAALERLADRRGPDTTVVGILNNRADRERRALQFADVAARDLDFDYLVTFGAYEEAVTRRLVDNGFDRTCIRNLGESRAPSIDTIVTECIASMPGERVLLVGFVNIHTHQAELLMDYLEGVERDRSVALEPEARPVPVPARGAGAASVRPRPVIAAVEAPALSPVRPALQPQPAAAPVLVPAG
ncbi:MAG: poly-gamma-glutamate synthase PgsB [Thermoleophilia bacterium]|nr:poly-gamma-glutamate synthase PgsB [Thermoleophilia bacterium]